MLQTDNSIRGKVMRELIARVASDNLIGRKFKSGELRKKMTEPEWRVPDLQSACNRRKKLPSGIIGV